MATTNPEKTDNKASSPDDLGKLMLRLVDFDLPPEKIAKRLKRWVVGQDEAVERSALILRHHMLRMKSLFFNDGKERHMPRHAVLLIGPTGCGKSYLASRLAEISGMPHYVEDCTMLTETGYVGRDVGDVMNSMITNAGEIFSAEYTVLLLDEIDKLAAMPSRSRDVSGGGAQDLLLQLLSRGYCPPIPRGTKEQPSMAFSPNKLLILAAGAFSGLSDIIQERLKAKRRIGLGVGAAPDENGLQGVTKDDLIAYGLKPELIGRFTDIMVLNDLKPEHLQKILKLPDGPLSAYANVAEMEGFQIAFEPELLQDIADEAARTRLGARDLAGVVSRLTHRAFFEAPSNIRRFEKPQIVFTRASLVDGSYIVEEAEA